MPWLILLRLILRFGAGLSCIAVGEAAAQPRHAAFVDASQVASGLKVEMRYFGRDNFVGRRIDGYEAPVCLLTREAATALAAVQQDLAQFGLGLKAFDCYRPVRAVAHFMRWARDAKDQEKKQTHYPDVDKRNLFRDGYISARSAHSRGSTIDLTLVRATDGVELDMGSPFDLFGRRSWSSSRDVSAEVRANRMLLAGAMRRRGFRPYDREWWHFTLANEPFPRTYFDFPVK